MPLVDTTEAEVIPITEADDQFHPYSEHPYETETFWVSFHHPERRLGGWIYTLPGYKTEQFTRRLQDLLAPAFSP